MVGFLEEGEFMEKTYGVWIGCLPQDTTITLG